MENKALNTFIENGLVIREAVPLKPERVYKIRDQGGDELMEENFEELLEVVEGMFTEGLGLFASNPKVGKTWLMIALALAVAAGDLFLGRRTEKGDVLFLAYEDSRRTLQRRLRHLGRPVPSSFRYDTGENIITMNNGLVAMLNEWCDVHPDAKLIVIDTLGKVRPMATGRVNAYDFDVKILSELKAFTMKRHVALILIHHLNKSKNDEGDVFNRINGTNGLTGTVDAMYVLDRKRGENNATLYISGREIIEDEMALRFDEGRWKSVDPATVERERYEAQPVVKAIKALLGDDAKASIGYEAFKDFGAEHDLFVGATRNEVHKALDRLADDLSRFDRIFITHKQIGSARGFEVIRNG